MKYLHICPPWYVFHGNGLKQSNVPLGAAYCARAAISVGWHALIWNGDMMETGKENQFSEEMSAYHDYLQSQDNGSHPVWGELMSLLDSMQPDVVGITALTASYSSALTAASLVKKKLPNCVTILGGPHPTALPHDVAQLPQVDVVVIGEGDDTLPDVLTRIRNGFPLAGTPGTVVSAGEEVVVGESRNNIADLDVIKWPARGHVYDPKAQLARDNFGLMLFSRGCPHACSFCASPKLWSRQVRWRSPVNVVDEMVSIHNEYDTRFFSFQDDTFTLNRDLTIKLMKHLAASGLTSVPGFRWACNTRPDRLDEELLEHMKAAGCAAIAVGIESGNPRLLKKMNKGFTVEQVRKSVKMIKDFGFIASGQFMVGYPTETENEMLDTVRLAEELECESVMLSVATPLPATNLYEEALQLKLISATGVNWAMVTTKNDGILMTEYLNGEYRSMAAEEKKRILADIHGAFDRIQDKWLVKKNSSRQFYEKQYISEDELSPAYGMR